MAKWLLLLASLSGFTGVALGAFAAHGLRGKLSENMLSVFQTGVSYQLWHTMALIGVAVLLLRSPDSTLLKATGVLFALGIVLFSGSLYLLTLSGIGKLGMITPLGGVLWLVAWLCLGLAVWRTL
ncbi:MAG: hypothetical protein CMK85_02505 [Pseudomonadales bacterium]|jgi:uncharacterized membrane protein YgdD (TMEM256/DUF423 family)|uniref:DUF423 domain-containing protein n=1 Tax=Halopseudomonas TaxID=2901189 RepID=UPI000C3DD747|nr:DUF423 domain-containing protein [Halopseudomonas aestusnigri]MAG99694.1 hypothetical protein [Pseudomonadales bacterium]MEE2799059.1 DUF423 domain-containing protein [Pseudomonadota bacterium]HBT57118.1 DUF423 domain-containing protein [Pseudomonas sp.]MAK74391.1 hypothetical protein [Pseudomonadales bacterium]MAP75674.1 hypothetical protein [Pseudomonadales bacterium]|tara:strand:+ start:207 stop:581 length:375 start_codon:yes stop_codon:yes gene_type:complete